MAEEKNVAAESTATETTTPDLPNITVGDLATMVNVVDAGSQRGAWKGEELELIGGLRNKLMTVIKAVNPDMVKENQTSEATAESTQAPEETAQETASS